MSALGDFIRTRRTELGKSQMDLADDCDVTQGAVASWETGATRPSRVLYELAVALDVHPDELRGLMGKKKRHINGADYGIEPDTTADTPVVRTWQREPRPMAVAEKKPVVASPVVPLPKPEVPAVRRLENTEMKLLIAKRAILGDIARIRDLLSVAVLYGDERARDLAEIVEPSLAGIEEKARGLTE
jgi:transcriptional regulator with XRE-family HTH domain